VIDYGAKLDEKEIKSSYNRNGKLKRTIQDKLGVNNDFKEIHYDSASVNPIPSHSEY